MSKAVTQIETSITEGKIEQLMQDFTEFLVLDGADESELIQWREDTKATLQASLKGKEV